MNRTLLIGRLTGEPEIRQAQSGEYVARYTLAVERMKKGEADFIRCIAFGKQAEFTEKYLLKGMKIAIEGRIQTGSYTDRNGSKVYTTEVVIDRQEFCEGKGSGSYETAPAPAKEEKKDEDGFMFIPDDVSDDGLPFA